MDDGLLSKIFSAAAGIWALVAMAFVALFKAWPLILERLNERKRDSATEKASDWQRIRDERDRHQTLHAKCEEEKAALQSEKAELMLRAVTAEAALQGYGIARQQVAVENAAERIAKADKPEDGK